MVAASTLPLVPNQPTGRNKKTQPQHADQHSFDMRLRPDTHPRTGQPQFGFESIERCQVEDRNRAHTIRATARSLGRAGAQPAPGPAHSDYGALILIPWLPALKRDADSRRWHRHRAKRMRAVSTWSPFDVPLPPPERNIAGLMVTGNGRHGFETPAAADRERLSRIAALRRSPDPRAVVVAHRLANCERGARCLSPACSFCGGRTRIWLCGEIAKLLAVQRQAGRADIKLVTLVHEDWMIPPFDIMRFCPEALVDRVRHQFLRAGTTGATVIGAVHGEFDRVGHFWQPHLHLITKGISGKALTLIRQRHYRRTARIYRPMVVQPLRNPVRQVSYLLKSYWPMKVRYVDARGRKSSTFQRIPEPYHSAYLVMLDQFNLLDLILLIGVRRYGNILQRLHT
jgi:hypothetical protein